MIKYFYRSVKEKEVKELPNFKIGSWIYVEAPEEDDLKFLVRKFKLDFDLLNDALDPHEVPRLERENETAYIFTRAPFQEEEITTIPLLIAVGQEFVLTLSVGRIDSLEDFVKSKIKFYTTQRTKFLIQIFSALDDHYNKLLTNISRRVWAARVRLEKIENKDIVQLVSFEEMLNDFLSALIPTNNVLNRLLTGGYLTLYQEDKNLIEDLFLGNGQLIETAKSNLKRIVNIRDAYSTIMSHDLNRIIKLLTALTIILTVPTVISGLYGMNVTLPLQDSSWAFVTLLAITFAILFTLLYIFIKNKWL